MRQSTLTYTRPPRLPEGWTWEDTHSIENIQREFFDPRGSLRLMNLANLGSVDDLSSPPVGPVAGFAGAQVLDQILDGDLNIPADWWMFSGLRTILFLGTVYKRKSDAARVVRVLRLLAAGRQISDDAVKLGSVSSQWTRVAVLCPSY